jgi:bleomycin hydrolase
MLDKEPGAPKKRRGMGKALLNLMTKYGMVDYDAMPGMDDTIPVKVIARGKEYTPKEFALSLCDSGEYIALTSLPDKPYYKEVDIDLPDNWMHDRFLNVPMDTLLQKTIHAVRHHRGVCWESSGHAMAVVGLARDDNGRPFFVMKNSWGTNQPHQGLVYMSFGYFREKTLAVEMPRDVFYSDSIAEAAALLEQLQ